MQDEKIKGRNSWIEGCWNIQRRASEPLPGLVLGTGFEDFFDSTCASDIKLFVHCVHSIADTFSSRML